MLRQALQSALPQQRQGTDYAMHIGPPTGGLNTRDSLVGMDPRDAIVLNNWFPQASEVWQRGGSTNFATGMTGTVQTLAVYSPVGGADQLIAFTNSGAYNVSAGGVIGGLMAGSAFTNGFVTTLNITNSAGNSFLWACNGVDTPMYWNGATWTAAAITGVTSGAGNIITAWIFKHRIWFIEKNTMNCYYLPLDSIQGAASQYPMGNLFKAGGYLVAGTNWTLLGGDGPMDALAIVSSEGEVAVFQGSNPDSATSWGLSGMYTISRPANKKCFFKLGGDVGFITENGVFPLSRALQLGSINFASALSNKIQPSIVAAMQAGGLTTQGWEACVYPAYNALIINLAAPPPNSPTQYVMNTVTGQWCSFSGWKAFSFAVFNGLLYFGAAGGIVLRAWDGVSTSDNGSDITTYVQQAYQYFGLSRKMKKTRLLRLLLGYDGGIDLTWGISADYNFLQPTSFLARAAISPGSPWDTSPWDTSPWTAAVQRYKRWMAAGHAPGYALSLVLQTAGNNSSQVRWAGTDFVFDAAGVM